MSARTIVVVAFTSTLAVSGVAQATYTGNDLDAWLRSYDRVEGRTRSAESDDVYRAATLLGFIHGVVGASSGLHVCIPQQKTEFAQLVAVVRKWHNEHPKLWGFPAWIITRDALEDAFPCAK